MMNGGHWDLQRRLLALLSASDLMSRGGVRVCVGVGVKGVKVASGKGDNETAGLVITMGHDEGRDQAGSVNKVQMRARDRLDVT